MRHRLVPTVLAVAAVLAGAAHGVGQEPGTAPASVVVVADPPLPGLPGGTAKCC